MYVCEQVLALGTSPPSPPRLPGSYTTALVFVHRWFYATKTSFSFFSSSSFLTHKNTKHLLHLRRPDSAPLFPCFRLLSVPLSRAAPHSLPSSLSWLRSISWLSPNLFLYKVDGEQSRWSPNMSLSRDSQGNKGYVRLSVRRLLSKRGFVLKACFLNVAIWCLFKCHITQHTFSQHCHFLFILRLIMLFIVTTSTTTTTTTTTSSSLLLFLFSDACTSDFNLHCVSQLH